MATIEFRGKVKRVSFVDGTKAYDYIQCPALERKHCDMAAFRCHAKYGPYANSDLFPGILRRLRAELFGDSGRVKLDCLGANVHVDSSGFLAKVTIEI